MWPPTTLPQDTVGVANHDFVLHVASVQPKKGKKKKLVPKKKPKLAKPPLKQLPDTRPR